MSLRNIFIMVFMVIVFPLTILFYNVNAFFMIVSLVLLYISIRNLRTLISEEEEFEEELNEEEEKEAAELGQVLGININKLGYGFIIAVDMIIITYFLYSFFMLDILILKAVAIVLMADWTYDIIRVIDVMMNGDDMDDDEEYSWKDTLNELYLWVRNIVNIAFIIATFLLTYVI